MSTINKILIKIDQMDKLNVELLDICCQYLSIKQMAIFSMINKDCNYFVQNNYFFNFCKKNYMQSIDKYSCSKKYKFIKLMMNHHKYFKRFYLSNPSFLKYVDDTEMLRIACINDHLKIAQWLKKVSTGTGSAIFIDFCAQSDNVEIAKLLAESCRTDEINDAFARACEGGNLNIMRWLYEKFPGIKSNDVRYYNNWFETACCQGHLEVAKWLIKTFPQINIDSNTCFLFAFGNGHLNVAMWLIEEFPNIDLQYCFPFCFPDACNGGHLDVVNWSIEIYPHMRTKVLYEGLSLAILHGRLTILEAIIKKYPQIVNLQKQNKFFSDACKNGHLEVAKWLIKKYPKINVRKNNDEIFKCVCKKSKEYMKLKGPNKGVYKDIAEWLVSICPDYIIKN